MGFDTSAAHCAAALASGGQILAETYEEMTKGQAERLFPLIDDMLSSVSVPWENLSAIGVGVGPGNFTGIRIAVASARGLSMSLGVPAIGVSGFEALAFGNEGSAILAVVDARRGNSHVQFISANGQEEGPKTLPVDEVAVQFSGKSLRVVGDRAKYIADHIGQTAEVGTALPVAKAVALIASSKHGATVAPPKPLYVRPADAAPSREVSPTILP